MDIDLFKQLSGLELGRYVEVVEKEGLADLDMQSLFDVINELSLDHKIYVIRWAAIKQLTGAADVAIDLIRDEQTPAGARLTIVRSLRVYHGVGADHLEALRNFASGVPQSIWNEDVDALSR